MTNDTKTVIKVAQALAGAPIGGAENFYTRLVCALGKYDQLQQRAFTRENGWREQQFKDANIPVSKHRLGGTLDIIGRYQYHKALREWQPDIVMTYMNRATMLTPPGNYKLVARLGHYYDLKYYKHCNYWIGITKGICDYMIEGGFPKERVFQIPNFVDESIAKPLPRDSFNTHTESPIILAAGRLHTNKGFDTLLRAMIAIPDVVLWLAGDGPEADNLKGLAKELGIVSRVRFLGWRNDINALMRSVDLFVCPSRHEGLGSIVPEAWFNECPIISTRSQGPQELIEHENTGLLTPIDDVNMLAEAINQVLNDRLLASNLKSQGKTEYLNKYQKTIITNRYLSLFNKLLQKSV